MKTELFRRVLTVVLSLTFVLSTVFGALSSVQAVDNSSLAARATVSSDAERALPTAPEGTANLLKGLTPTVYKNTGSGDSEVGDPIGGNSTVIENLTDGDTTTKADVGGFRFNDGSGNDMSETYSTAFTFDLKASSDLNQLVVVNDGSVVQTITEHYAVFASDNLSKLYDNESFIIDVSGNDKLRNIITFNSGIKARYIGIRVYDPGSLTANQQYVRMREFALYGVLGEISTGATLNSDDTAELPALGTGEANLLSGARPKTYYDMGSSSITESTTPENDAATAPLSNLTDGNPATSAAIGGTNLRYVNSSGTFMGETWATYWTFDLEYISDLSKMTFIHHSTEGLRTEHFQIYLSNTSATIFSADNMIINIDNNTSRRTIVEFPENTKARYVGIKYFNPGESGSFTANNRYVRMNELALFGVLGTDPGEEESGTGTGSGDFTMTSSDDYVFDETLGEKNFISGISENIDYVYYSDFGNSQSSGKISSVKLGDGLFNDNFRNSTWFFAEYDEATATEKYIGKGIDEGKYYVDLTIPLGGTKKITGIQMMNAGSPLATYKYKIYLASSAADLFKEESMIIDAVNEAGKKVNTFKNTSENEHTGKFIGIRIIDPTNGKGIGDADAHKENDSGKCYIYPRINELAVYGSDVATALDDITLDDIMEMPEEENDNLLKGLNPSSITFYNTDEKYYRGVGSFSCGTTGGGDTLTDGLPTGDWRSSSAFAAYVDDSGNAYYIGDGIQEGSMYYDIVFDVGTESTLTTLAIFHHNSQLLRTAKYELYFGNSTTDLFETKFVAVDNTAGKQRNLLNLTKLNGGEAISARYMGIRIIDPTVGKNVGTTIVTGNNSKLNNVYPRFNEIALYGEYLDPNYGSSTVIFDNNGTLPEDWGRNLTKGFYPSPMGTNTATNSYARQSVTAESCINDESTTSEDYRIPGFKFAENLAGNITVHTSRGDGKKYLDLIYDIKSEAIIDGIAILHHRTQALRTYDYELFASVSSDDLCTPENSLGRVTNAGYYRNAWNYKALGKSFNARYICMRVYDPTQYHADAITADVQNNIYLRLMEWAIYGQYVDADFVYKERFTPLYKQEDYSLFESYGTNLLQNRDATGLMLGGGTVSSGSVNRLKMTDGDVTTGFDITEGAFTAQDGSTYFQMYYDLSDGGTSLYSFTDFIYLGLNQNNPAAATGWWQLYISDDSDMLFDDASMVFEYNAVKYLDPDVGCQGQVINLDKPVIGNFIGIRILACNTTLLTSVYPRIYELAAYGTLAPLDMTPVNIAEDMPVDAYLQESSGDLTEVKISNLTAQEIVNLTDGSSATVATVKTNNKPLNIVYNLCQDALVNDIYISSADGKTPIKKYKVYASDNLNDIWSDDSLLFSKTTSGAKRTGKTFSKSTTLRYVRIEILDKASSISIGEIEMIGPKYKKLRSKNLVKSNGKIDFYTQDLKTGKISYFTPEASSKLKNDALEDAIGFTEGVAGKETVNILISLDDMKTINKLELYFAKRGWEFMPTLTNIYLGSDLEDITALDAEPSFVYKGLPDNSTIRQLISPTAALYVRISFVEGGNGFGYFEEMTYALAEIRAYGTAVVGANPDSDLLVEFEDKKLGVKWGVVKQSDNDIYSEVASSTVTVSKATNWQKRSLEKTPYMQIVGGKKYTFKFYDITGKEIKDFSSRQLRFSFKLRDGMDASTAMAGYAGNKWYIEVYNSSTDVEDGYVTLYEDAKFDNISFSILKMISSTDPYWNTIGELEDYGDEEPQYAPTTALDASTSTAKIVTEDGDFYIDPRGALRLPINAIFSVETMVWNIPDNIYSSLYANGVANPDDIAVSYTTMLSEDGLTEHIFDGKVKLMLRIPDVVKGYFSSYQLVNVNAEGQSQFIEYTRKGDYIYFETTSLDDYALIGVDYHPNGDAVYEDGFVNVDGEISPDTGDTTTILFINLALVSLLGIVLLNIKKFRTQR